MGGLYVLLPVNSAQGEPSALSCGCVTLGRVYVPDSTSIVLPSHTPAIVSNVCPFLVTSSSLLIKLV